MNDEETNKAMRVRAWTDMVALACVFLLGLLMGPGLHPSARAASGETANTLGQSQPNAYLFDKQTAAYRTGITVAVDPSVLTQQTNISDVVLDGRQTIDVSPRFTSSTGTATIGIFYYWKASDGTYYGKCAELQTCVAGTTREASGSGKYLLDVPIRFDAAGSNRVEVRVVAMGGGETSMDLWVGTY